MWVLATNSLTRGITDTGLALGAATALVVGAYRVADGATELTTLLMVLMASVFATASSALAVTQRHDGLVSGTGHLFRIEGRTGGCAGSRVSPGRQTGTNRDV